MNSSPCLHRNICFCRWAGKLLQFLVRDIFYDCNDLEMTVMAGKLYRTVLNFNPLMPKSDFLYLLIIDIF